MEDFNLPGPERIALLKDLQEVMGDVPLYFWAACHVCDLAALQKLVEIARLSCAAALMLSRQTYTLVLYWTQSSKGLPRKQTPKKPSGLGSSPASTSTPPTKRQKTIDSPEGISRSQPAADLARERDGVCCVLTGEPGIDVAHIYPFCWLKDPEEDTFGVRHAFWNQLKLFWPEEKVAAWQAELFPIGLSQSGVERVDNLITLSKQAHVYWNQGAFALKPISVCDNNTILKVQFFWQKKQSDTQAPMSLLTTPLSTKDLDHNEGAFAKGTPTLSCSGRKFIESGQNFELKTDNPIKKPLPSFKLLELQWFLTRITGMAGAAFPYEAGWGDDSDDEEEVPNLDFDEVGDISLLSDIKTPNSPEFLHKVNRLPVEGPKKHTEEAEGGRADVGATL